MPGVSPEDGDEGFEDAVQSAGYEGGLFEQWSVDVDKDGGCGESSLAGGIRRA